MNRRFAIATFLAAILALPLMAQEDKPAKEGAVLVAPNLVGPLIGLYSANVEFATDEQMSVEIQPSYYNFAASPILGTFAKDSGFSLWFASCKVGVNYYINKVFTGGFVGAYAKGTYFTIGSDSIATLDTGSIGAGAKIGYRWTGKWVSFVMGASYEYNKAFASVTSSDDYISSVAISAVDGGMPGAFLLLSFVL